MYEFILVIVIITLVVVVVVIAFFAGETSVITMQNKNTQPQTHNYDTTW